MALETASVVFACLFSALAGCVMGKWRWPFSQGSTRETVSAHGTFFEWVSFRSMSTEDVPDEHRPLLFLAVVCVGGGDV